MKKLELLLAVLTLAVSLSGCLDATALDEYGYVLSVGVDAGEVKRYNVSFLIQKTGESQESQAGAGSLVISAEGDSIFEAIAIAHLGVPYELNFMRTNYIAFSRELAENGLMAEFLKASFETLNLRDSAKIVIVLGKCSKYFDGLYTEDNPSVAKRQYSLFQNYMFDAVIPMTNLSLLREAVYSGRFDAVLATGSTDTSIEAREGTDQGGGNGESSGGGGEESSDTGPGTTAGVKRSGGRRSYSRGSAVFNGDRLAGVLNGEDTEILLMAMGKFEEGRISYCDENGEYSFKLSQIRRPQIKLDISGDAPYAKMHVYLAALVELDTAGNSLARWDTVIRPTLEQYVESELKRVFEICRDAGSDAMGFGRSACEEFGSVSAWRAYDWKSRYTGMDAEFEATISPEDVQNLKGGR